MGDEGTTGEGGLSSVGVSAFDERVYRALVGGRSATPAELGAQLDVSPDRVDRALARLRAQGLASRLAGRLRRYTAVEPEAAIETLVRQRTAQLEAVRGTAAELAAAFHAMRHRNGAGGAVEVLVGPQSLGRWFVRLQHQAREEMLVLDRPPYALAPDNPVEPVSLAQGVHWRGVYSPEALQMPGSLEEIERLATCGEEARVLPGLSMKMAIADRKVALLPLSLDLETAHCALVRESTLLDGLVDLFEAYWARAVPIGNQSPAPELAEEDRTLVTLLASGLTDAAIARRLGVSLRTMRRRTRRIFDELSATNRFQAGLQAARRGWL
ncbi:hypothetical protein AQ490_00975 [Wenjunlia vitaminophila]|uniref:HTH luxR-type domain-containing protein n=1 Tax=Wenjunlia vitaminophila TaxID=76728 RepID=A0A0T6LZH3_WENVI|nr:helix-turn-helix domain-containing protein [Wenjunlia vitaminophila]KRV51369.1 hypothetical protein AQ490_00975 [Wenjunlia vitaminophila]